jgi:hypothetical protein
VRENEPAWNLGDVTVEWRAWGAAAIRHLHDWGHLLQQRAARPLLLPIAVCRSRLRAASFCRKATELTRATEGQTMTVGCPLSGYPLHSLSGRSHGRPFFLRRN